MATYDAVCITVGCTIEEKRISPNLDKRLFAEDYEVTEVDDFGKRE